MGPQGRKDIHLAAPLGQRMVIYIGNEPGLGVKAGEIRREDQNVFQFSPRKRGKKGLPDLLIAEARLCPGNFIDLHFIPHCKRKSRRL